MSEQKSSLKVNFIMNMILTMSSLIFPLITFPYVSRILLADGNGKVQLATAVVCYFVLVSQLGLPMYGVKACAIARDDRQKLSKTVHELCIINLAMTLVSYIVFFALLWYIPRLREESPLYLITSASILLNTIGMEWLFKGMEQYKYIAVRSIAFKIISIIAMFILVRQKSDYVIYAAISVFASYGFNVINFIKLRKVIDFKPQKQYDVKRHLKPLFIIFFMSCAATIYTNLDSVMLGFMTTDADVGYYNVAVKIKNILLSVITAIGAVILPRVSYYYEQGDKEAFWRIISKALRFVTLISIPATLYFMLFAKPSIFLISGSVFANSILPMVIIMPTIILIAFTNVMGLQILVPMGKEKIILYSSIGGAVADLIVNAVLIPSLKSAGAAIGTLVAEFVVLIIQYHALRKEMRPLIKDIGLKQAVLGTAISSLACIPIIFLKLSNFWVLAISCIIFFGLYLLILTICREPLVLDIEKQIFAKLKKIVNR